MAITTGDMAIDELRNKKSTSCRLPGEALQDKVQLAEFLVCRQISIRSCLVSKASRRKASVALLDSKVVDKPVVASFPPQYLITVVVLYIVCAI